MNNKTQEKNEHLNVLGGKLEVCSCKPLTVWFRDGFCKYDSNDGGNHSICCVMDDNFLKYSNCLLYTSPSPRDATLSRMPSSA